MCTTLNGVRAPCGHRDMGPPIDHTGGVKLGSQKGVILAAQNEPKPGIPTMYISTPAWRSDPPFHMPSTRGLMETPMHLAPKVLHATRPGDNPNWVHNCQNGKIIQTHFGLAP